MRGCGGGVRRGCRPALLIRALRRVWEVPQIRPHGSTDGVALGVIAGGGHLLCADARRARTTTKTPRGFFGFAPAFRSRSGEIRPMAASIVCVSPSTTIAEPNRSHLGSHEAIDRDLHGLTTRCPTSIIGKCSGRTCGICSMHPPAPPPCARSGSWRMKQTSRCAMKTPPWKTHSKGSPCGVRPEAITVGLGDSASDSLGHRGLEPPLGARPLRPVGDPIGDRPAGRREGERHDSGRRRQGEREAELPARHESRPFRWPLVHGRRLAVGVQAAVECGRTSRDLEPRQSKSKLVLVHRCSSHRNAHLIERAAQA